jgi:hypothetical protein
MQCSGAEITAGGIFGAGAVRRSILYRNTQDVCTELLCAQKFPGKVRVQNNAENNFSHEND